MKTWGGGGGAVHALVLYQCQSMAIHFILAILIRKTKFQSTLTILYKTRTKHVLLLSLQESLPRDYDYHICNYQEVEDGKHEAEFRIDICNEDDAKLWLEKYQQLTKVTFRVEATKPKSGRMNLFKAYYRCQHKTLPRSETANQKKSSKNTNCPAKLAMTVKRILGKLSR